MEVRGITNAINSSCSFDFQRNKDEFRMQSTVVESTSSRAKVRDFREACCEYFNCKPEEYEQAVFWHCLYDHAEKSAKILWQFSQSFFQWDIYLVQTVANATALSEMEHELNSYRHQYRVSGILRRKLRIRLSGQKLLDLASKVWCSGASGSECKARKQGRNSSGCARSNSLC